MKKKLLFIGYEKCSTCIRAYKFFKDKGYDIEYHEITKEIPTVEELKKYHKDSGQAFRNIFNYSGVLYRKLNLKDKLDLMSDEEKYQLLASDGMMIKRPILVSDDLTTFGFKEKLWQ